MLCLGLLLIAGALFVWAYRRTLSEDVLMMEFWKEWLEEDGSLSDGPEKK